MFNINLCRWRDSNRGPLLLEATALLTEPQPLPNLIYGKIVSMDGDQTQGSSSVKIPSWLDIDLSTSYLPSWRLCRWNLLD